jgi:Putative restriction endonuclease
LRKRFTFTYDFGTIRFFNGQLKKIRTMDFENQVAHQETAERQESRSAAEIQYELERNKPMPSLRHSIAQSRLCWELNSTYGEKFDILPELDIQFLNRKVVPDVSIYPKSKDDWHNDILVMTDLPLLPIEILTYRQPIDDIFERIHHIYFPAGLKSAWVVLPSAQSVMIFTPNAKPQTFNSGIMHDAASGFEVDLDKIF